MKSAIRIIIILILWSLLLPAGEVLAHREIEEQIRATDRLIAEKPGDAKLYLRRGELYRIHREWQKAEADYKKALELDPELLTVRYCLGRMHLEAGRPEKARGFLDVYLKARPNDPAANAARGRALAEMGKYLAAVADLDRAIAHSPGDHNMPELYLERARALVAAGPKYLDRAIDGLNEGLERLGEPVTLQLYAIDLEVEARRYDSALKRLDLLASQAARQEPWLMRKGTVLEAAGRREDALKVYRQALAAVESLPPNRRGSKAVKRLESEARAAVERTSDDQKSH
jgi:tetratricopeptide (TPR) repeat protein